jgi:hypothetical protein
MHQLNTTGSKSPYPEKRWVGSPFGMHQPVGNNWFEKSMSPKVGWHSLLNASVVKQPV